MSAHTPGPLEVRIGGNYVRLGRLGYNALADASHDCGAASGGLAEAILPHGYTKSGFAEAVANMRLYASAPDLLAACKDAIDVLRTDENYVDDKGGEVEWLVALRDAVAKARAPR